MSVKMFSMDDFDIKLSFGRVCINVLWLRTGGFDSTTHINTHCHSSYELHLIPYGSGIVYVNGKTFSIGKDTLYLTGPDVYHEQIVVPEDPMEEYCINFELTGGTNRRRNNLHEDIDIIPDIIRKTKFWLGKDTHGCCDLFDKIMREMDNKYLGYCTSIQNYLTQIFINISRNFSGNIRSGCSLPIKDKNALRRIIIDKYFNEVDKKLSINDLSEKVGLSVRQLNRIMLEYYNMSFNDKLEKTRMMVASDLLKNTTLSIKEISERVGIGDPSYFSRVFKKFWGCAPSRFR